MEKTDCPVIEKICVLLLAMCPILQYYKGFFVNAAITVLLIVTPYALIKILKKRYISYNDLLIVLPLIVFFLYKVVDHGTTFLELGQSVVFTILVIAIACGCFNTKYFIKIITIVSIVACICIIIQYIFYYVFGFHIQFAPTSLLLERSNHWVLGVETGRYSITGKMTSFYRPSAFFLEPSHMFTYMFMPLLLLILSNDNSGRKKGMAALLSLGMILSTSGMGIMTTLGAWIVYIGMRDGVFCISNYFQPYKLFVILILVAVVALCFFEIPFLQRAILRIFTAGSDYTNAIAGRNKGNRMIQDLSDLELLIGRDDLLSNVKLYMSSFSETMCKYGIIGTIISYLFFVQGLFNLKGSYFWISLVIIILSFFSAHTHSTMFLIYCVFVFVEGFKSKNVMERRCVTLVDF